MGEMNKPRYAVVIGWYTNANDARTRAELSERKGIHATIVDTERSDVDFPDPVRDLAAVITDKLDELISAVGGMCKTTAPASDPGNPETGKILFGSFIRMYRVSNKLTQTALGERFGISGTTIAKWEAGGKITRPMLAAVRFAMSDVPQETWDKIYVPLSGTYGTKGADR